MDADERDICTFLQSWQGQYVSGREVCKRAGGKWRFRQDPDWAIPVLARLADRGDIEADATGHFRLRPPEKKKEKERHISPQLKEILERSGKKFEDIITVEGGDEPDGGPAGPAA